MNPARVPARGGLTTEIGAHDQALPTGYLPSEIKRWGGTFDAATLKARAREEQQQQLRAAQRQAVVPVSSVKCEICDQVFPSRVKLTLHQRAGCE